MIKYTNKYKQKISDSDRPLELAQLRLLAPQGFKPKESLLNALRVQASLVKEQLLEIQIILDQFNVFKAVLSTRSQNSQAPQPTGAVQHRFQQ